MMKRMSIGQRIAMGFIFSIVVLATIAASSYRSIRQLVEAAWWRTHTYEVIAQLDQVHTILVDAETGQRGYIITGDETYLEPYNSAIAKTDASKQKLRTLTQDNPSQLARLDRLESLLRTRMEVLATNIAMRRDKGFDAVKGSVMAGNGKRVMDDIRTVMSEMANDEKRLLAVREKDADAAVELAQSTLIAGSIVALVLVFVANTIISRSITGPLDKLVEGTTRLGAGELGHRIVIDGADETARLSESFNTMAKSLQKASAEREAVLAAVTEGVQSLGAAWRELITGANQQATGMQEQAAAVAETVAVVEEVSRASEQTAERAREAATVARRSEEVSRTGGRAVSEVLSTIAGAKQQADVVAERIVALAERTQAIGEIVTLISEIAEQTNLLALNAAIEASRAGEQGLGFSVVAQEVKALAEESKKATRRVRDILGDIQKTANSSVLATEEGTRSMTEATRAAGSAGETIRALEQVVVDVAQAADQISASAGQQAIGLAQIQQAMRDVNQVSAQNLAATHQAQRAATDLADLGQKLQGLVS